MTTPVIRLAQPADLPEIVAIYNASIPGRMSTADLEPVTVEQRMPWFAAHDPARRPLWVADLDGHVIAWLSFSDFYGRPAYAATAEVGVYVSPEAQGMRVGEYLLRSAIEIAPSVGVRTLLWISFAHNDASLRLAVRVGFREWGMLPGVTELDGVRRDIMILGLEVGEGSGDA
jgi:L-amino acid N-acyltransferase YncA